MNGEIKYLKRADTSKIQMAKETLDHPMRRVTEEVAFDSNGWTRERAGKVAALFDEMAKEWAQKDFSERELPVFDALARGGVAAGILGLELGCGTGAYSSLLSGYFESLLCVDISFEMLLLKSSDGGVRVRGDGCRLPVRDGSVDGLICINTFLFPDEVDRILSSDGYLLWVSTSGDQTPIYLSPEKVGNALRGRFHGVASEAGSGTWSVFRRSQPMLVN